ncbi:MAG: nucleotidyltransferase domain-containing protein [Mariprofundus sp.]|nr:nucleotidyltransferase domain-containing protein [Mariprofundus sp.]
MRLTEFQSSRIQKEAKKFFGSQSHVWLFGSRVDDGQRGGDIDLYIEPGIQDVDALVDARLSFLVEIHRVLGNQKIDVVLHRDNSSVDLPIYRIARETGERLL